LILSLKLKLFKNSHEIHLVRINQVQALLSVENVKNLNHFYKKIFSDKNVKYIVMPLLDSDHYTLSIANIQSKIYTQLDSLDNNEKLNNNNKFNKLFKNFVLAHDETEVN